MKHIILIRILAFVTLGGSLLLGQRNAVAIELAPHRIRLELSKANGDAGDVEAIDEVTQATVSPTPQQTHPETIGEKSSQNHATSNSDAASATAFAGLEAAFSQERSDVDWSQQAEERVRVLVRPITNKDTILSSVHCRTTLCRVEFSHTTEAQFHELMDALRSVAMSVWRGPGGGGMVGIDEDRRIKSVFYLAKEGTDLPLGPATSGDSGGGHGSQKLSTGH